MLCGDDTREESCNLVEEEEDTIPTKGRMYYSQERGQWQLKENKTTTKPPTLYARRFKQPDKDFQSVIHLG